MKLYTICYIQQQVVNYMVSSKQKYNLCVNKQIHRGIDGTEQHLDNNNKNWLRNRLTISVGSVKKLKIYKDEHLSLSATIIFNDQILRLREL